jgi:hypothetical protein
MDKSSVDLLKQELQLLNEYVDRVDAVQTEFLLIHCELLLNYARAAELDKDLENEGEAEQEQEQRLAA